MHARQLIWGIRPATLPPRSQLCRVPEGAADSHRLLVTNSNARLAATHLAHSPCRQVSC